MNKRKVNLNVEISFDAEGAGDENWLANMEAELNDQIMEIVSGYEMVSGGTEDIKVKVNRS